MTLLKGLLGPTPKKSCDAAPKRMIKKSGVISENTEEYVSPQERAATRTGTEIPGEGLLPKEVDETAVSSKSNPTFDNLIDTHKDTPVKVLGHVSAKHESAGDPKTIAHVADDPGGASYGAHQLSSKAGSLDSFMERSGFDEQFEGLQPGTKEYDDRWVQMSDNPEFVKAQRDYIRDTHFIPLRVHADKSNIRDTFAINEALYSMSVQHGRAKRIVDNANLNPELSERETIERLYKSRTAYIEGLSSLSARLKKVLAGRYQRERLDVLALIED